MSYEEKMETRKDKIMTNIPVDADGTYWARII